MRLLLDVDVIVDVANLAALIPIYASNGANISQLYLRDGRVLTVDMRLKTLLAKLKSRSVYNVDFLGESQALVLGQKQLLPVPLAPGCILWAVKVRRPIGGSDGAYGYLAINAIERLADAGAYILGQEQAIPVIGSRERLARDLSLLRLIEGDIFRPAGQLLSF